MLNQNATSSLQVLALPWCSSNCFWMPLRSWWRQTAAVWGESQDALQATPSVLWKIIQIIISLCPTRIQSKLSQQGRVEMFLVHLPLVIALLCSTYVLTHVGLWTSTTVHCNSGFFPRGLGDPGAWSGMGTGCPDKW